MKKIALGNLASINRGLSWSLDRESSEPVLGSSPVLRIGNIQNKLDTRDLIYISKVSSEQKEKHKVGENSIVMVGSNGNHDRIGNCCIIKNQSDFLYASFLIGLVPHKDKVDPDFLYYVISSPQIQREITDSVTGSTGLANLSLSFLRELPISIPNTSTSQTQIAAVLSCIDLAIGHTEALIAKQQRIKTGLMQDLLTKGIDENGNICSAATHKFISSDLGMIHEGWIAKNIGELCYVTKLAGYEFTKHIEYVEDGEIIALRALNIKNEKLDLNNVQRISQKVSDALPRSKVHKDDILITYIGAYIGDVLLINDSGKYHLAPNIARIVTGKRLLPEYLEIFMRSHLFQNQIKNLISTTATPSLTMTQIRNIKVCFPKGKDEQMAIVIYYRQLTDQIDSNKSLLKKLKLTKSGLTRDLLTGNVRVDNLLVESGQTSVVS